MMCEGDGRESFARVIDFFFAQFFGYDMRLLTPERFTTPNPPLINGTTRNRVRKPLFGVLLASVLVFRKTESVNLQGGATRDAARTGLPDSGPLHHVAAAASTRLSASVPARRFRAIRAIRATSAEHASSAS